MDWPWPLATPHTPIHMLRPLSSCLPPLPQCDGIRRWCLWEVTGISWGHGGGALMLGVSALRVVRELASLCFPPCEDTMRSQRSATWKTARTGTQLCWHPDPRPPASRLWEMNFCYLNCPVYEIFADSSLNQASPQDHRAHFCSQHGHSTNGMT